MQLPLQPQLRFARQDTGGVTDFQPTSSIYNGIVEVGDKPFTTNRPIFETRGDASVLGRGAIGRGCYHWAKGGYTYTVNDDEITYGDTLLVCTGSAPATGTSPCYFAEIGDYLVLLDPSGNAGYFAHSGTPTVFATITDVDFPPNQTTALQLALGGAGYKGRIYVMDTNGTIWNSALEDPSSWSGGDNITAEFDPDGGICLTSFNNELVAFGNKTIEYFYHAANPTNSPLSVRQDVVHSVGMAYFATASVSNDALYFVGHSATGGRSVYKMVGHSLEKISKPNFDTYLSSPFVIGLNPQNITTLYGSAMYADGRTYYMLTMFYGTSTQTYVYDDYTKYWYEWGYDEESITGFPIVQWAHANNSVSDARGLLANGDIIVATSDWGDTQADNGPQAIIILTGNQNYETNKVKFMSNVTLDCFVTHAETEQTTQTAELRFLDEGEIDPSGSVGHDIELLHRYVSGGSGSNCLSRAGSFRMRNSQLTIPTDSDVTRTEIYALDFDLKVGL